MALTDKLSAIGTAIRAKTGKEELLTLDEMPIEIQAIQTGGAVETIEITANGTYTAPEGIDGYNPITVNVPQDGSPSDEAFVLTGDCTYRFSGTGWNWFIEQYGNQITSNNITNCLSMFLNNTGITSIPFEINCIENPSTGTSITKMFSGCTNLTSIPKITAKPVDMTSMFHSCYRLRYFPEDIATWFDWSYLESLTGKYSGDRGTMFVNCYSLRTLPIDFIKPNNTYVNYNYSIYYQIVNRCYALDEIIGLPVPYINATWNNNAFNYSFEHTYRLKNMTFALDPETNAPYVVNWKSQTIDLTQYTGWLTGGTYSPIIGYNSGITIDKRIVDDASYQALKDDPDWFTDKVEYSRYNHDSAVATINSLPDTSAYLATAGGTNTIKFKGAAGELTDGGAINTLTEEEIAVATAKGWTVTLV